MDTAERGRIHDIFIRGKSDDFSKIRELSLYLLRREGPRLYPPYPVVALDNRFIEFDRL